MKNTPTPPIRHRAMVMFEGKNEKFIITSVSTMATATSVILIILLVCFIPATMIIQNSMMYPALATTSV